MKELISRIYEELADFNANADVQVSKGNKAAGLRARRAALALIRDLREFRRLSIDASK